MRTKLRVMIVDDEPLARRRLEKILKVQPDVKVVAVARHGREALDTIEAARPNLLLLDVRMPGIDGFDLLENIPASITPAVVFVTAFDSYALQAFSVHAVDYVLKPVAPERLGVALDQARRDIASRDVHNKFAELQRLTVELREQARTGQPPFDKEVWVRQRSELIRIATDQIDWIEAEKDYVRIHAGDRSYLHRGLIGALEDRLDPAEFMRVHRSAIVRLDRIRAISRSRLGTLDIQLIPGASVRVGRRYSSDVRSRVSTSSE
jgi:two-component system, LytTR family, response regulator